MLSAQWILKKKCDCFLYVFGAHPVPFLDSLSSWKRYWEQSVAFLCTARIIDMSLIIASCCYDCFFFQFCWIVCHCPKRWKNTVPIQKFIIKKSSRRSIITVFIYIYMLPPVVRILQTKFCFPLYLLLLMVFKFHL